MIRTNKKGFTLIELMVVIVIIGILAALAVPKFMDASVKAKTAEVPPSLAGWEHAEFAYVAETNGVGITANLAYDAPVGSKWFNYSDYMTGGTGYQAQAKADIGSTIKTNNEVWTSCTSATGVPKHGKNITYTKYLAAW